MKVFYGNDAARGAGYGFLLVRDCGLAGLEGLRFSIKRGSDQSSLGAGGWLPSASPLPAGDLVLAEAGFALSVGPEIVNQLDSLENYRISLESADGSSESGPLLVRDIIYAPAQGGNGLATPPEAPVVRAASSPAPSGEAAAEGCPLPGPAPSGEPLVREEKAVPDLPGLSRPPERHRRLLVPVTVFLLLLAAALLFWKLSLEKEAAPEEQATRAEPARTDPAVLPEEAAVPVRQQTALARARAHLSAKGSPEQSLALGKELRGQEDGADAAFLLLEDAAQQGNAEAMLLTGSFYDPLESAPCGSIRNDPAEALRWYTRARAAGADTAGTRLEALRAWAEAEAARGEAGARNSPSLPENKNPH